MEDKENKKSNAGRPSKINSIDFSKVRYCGEQGYTDKELAEIFDVCEDTINNWKKNYPRFFESLKKGKLLADEKVKASLYQRACGYSHPDIDIKVIDGEVVKTPLIKHYPPDTTACIIWLKNRQPDDWKDRKHIEHSGELTVISEKLQKARNRVSEHFNRIGTN